MVKVASLPEGPLSTAASWGGLGLSTVTSRRVSVTGRPLPVGAIPGCQLEWPPRVTKAEVMSVLPPRVSP